MDAYRTQPDDADAFAATSEGYSSRILYEGPLYPKDTSYGTAKYKVRVVRKYEQVGSGEKTRLEERRVVEAVENIAAMGEPNWVTADKFSDPQTIIQALAWAWR